MFTNKASIHESTEHIRASDKRMLEENFIGLSKISYPNHIIEKNAATCRKLEPQMNTEFLDIVNYH